MLDGVKSLLAVIKAKQDSEK
jgi:hypothetical protein